MLISLFKKIFGGLFSGFFRRKKKFKIGLYGPPNSGKTTLANAIIKDILKTDGEFGKVSNVAHETRKILVKEELVIKIRKRSLVFDLIDTPGIATRIDYEKFVRQGINSKDAKTRAREATKGVIESIKWLDSMDIVIIVLDSTKNPYNQVNLTIIGNLEARKIPTLIIANKIDLKSSKVAKISEAFTKYKILGISAKFSQNLQTLYEALEKIAK